MNIVQAMALPEHFIANQQRHLSLSAIALAEKPRDGLMTYFGRNVMLRMRGQLSTILAILALDGVARRLLLCPADVPDEQIPLLMQGGQADLMLTDEDMNTEDVGAWQGNTNFAQYDTEWILFTSGTSGLPKLAQHSLSSLTAPLHDNLAKEPTIWSTFYDIRRYGGMQIFLRALMGGGSMVLSDADEPIGLFLARLGKAGVKYISGTPSHWRRVLMSGAADRIAPTYLRLSGEMVGQDILDRLRAIYPNASIGQAYASTEAGVVFVVNDGHAGFPMSMIGENAGGIQIRITRDTLQVHSSAMAARYLGQDSKQLVDAEGFVDTGDVIERRGDRYFFVGRRGGVINVGGMKVYPEEVEAVINQHPAVLTSRVWSRPNAITGTVIAADIVPVLSDEGKMHDFSRVRAEIMVSCQAKLAPYKVPVRLTEVTEISITKSGKIDRRHA